MIVDKMYPNKLPGTLFFVNKLEVLKNEGKNQIQL